MSAIDDIEQHIRTLVAARLDPQAAAIDSEASLIDDLGADSLDMVGLIMTIEDEFDIDIPDEDAVQLLTLRQLTEYVEFAVAVRDTTHSLQIERPRYAAGEH